MSEIVEDNREENALIYASDNVRHLSRMELSGGGQIVIQGRFAYVGHQHGPEGTTILDISDPRQPKVVAQLMTSHPWSHSHKVRVVGDLMVVNSEIEPGKGDRLSYPDGGFRIYDIATPCEPQADHIREDQCARRAPFRPGRKLCLYLDRDGRLRWQHPGHL